jgi:hypothetical protein
VLGRGDNKRNTRQYAATFGHVRLLMRSMRYTCAFEKQQKRQTARNLFSFPEEMVRELHVDG